MKRREFISLLSSATAMWPLAASAQQLPVIAVLGGAADNAEGQTRVKAFTQGLQDLGRVDGRNVRLDIRLLGDDLSRIRTNAAELVRANPAVILSIGTPVLVALREATRTIPIIFANVSEPVDGGFVDSEARPGGNITGFTSFVYSIGGKWLEVVKEISPRLTHVLVLLNPANYTSRGLLRSIQGAAATVGVQVVIGRVSVGTEIAPTVTAFASRTNGAMIVAPDPLIATYIGDIVTLSIQHRLPSIFQFRYYPAAGGLLSYGPDISNIFRNAATYANRILKGEKISELPVQTPTRYQLVINLKTAKALGLTVPPTLLARADEVIE